MNFLRGIVSWVDSLETGSQFRKWTSILLKILGVLVLIGVMVAGIRLCVDSIRASDNLEIGAETVVIIVSILALCVFVIIGIILIMLFWNRANKIRALGEESHFTLMPIAVILIRLIGEIGFLVIVGTGMQGLLAGLGIQGVISDSRISDVLQFSMSDLWMLEGIGFIAGVIALVVSIISGALVLIFWYFIAELINLFVDMATNLKKIESSVSTEEVVPEIAEETNLDV